MASKTVTINANSEFELASKEKVVNKLNSLTADQVKRLGKLIDSPKAMAYLSSDLKFASLQAFL